MNDQTEHRIAQAEQRAFRAEVAAAAAGRFADSGDAVALLADRGHELLDDRGDVDRDALGAALADLLRRKPHLAAGRGTAARPPAPNRAQGTGEHRHRAGSGSAGLAEAEKRFGPQPLSRANGGT